MSRYVIRRVLYSIPVLLVASILVFYVVRTTRDPTAALRTNPRITAEALQKIRHDLGLDKSGFEQYTTWLGNFVQGDWGVSILTETPVRSELINALGNSAILGLAGVLLSLLIGSAIGIIAAVRQYSLFDTLATGGAFFGLSMPNFWFALLLQIFFGLYLRQWFKTGTPIFFTAGKTTPGAVGFDLLDLVRHLALPALVLAVQIIAVYSRLMRASMLETLNTDYMRTARAKGLSERRVIFRHGVRNALIPLTTQLGIDLGSIAGGLIITEAIFQWPGMGSFFIGAMGNGDYPQILAWMMVVVASVIIFNLLVDIAYAVLDPRIRYA